MRIEFDGFVDEFNAMFRVPLAEGHSDVISLLNEIKDQGINIMGNTTLAKEALEQLNVVTNKLADAVSEVAANDQAEDEAFRAKITELEAKVAAGETITAEDIAGLTELKESLGATAATIAALEQTLRSMGTSPADPIPEVEIPPIEDVPTV